MRCVDIFAEPGLGRGVTLNVCRASREGRGGDKMSFVPPRRVSDVSAVIGFGGCSESGVGGVECKRGLRY